MTTKEFLQAKLIRFGLTDQQIEIIIAENNLSADDNVDVSKVKEAMYNSFSEWLPLHTQITEGGVSESWNFQSVSLYYGLLCKELGKENVLSSIENKNEVRDKSNIW